MKIGVFDSGVGGLSVANAVQKAFPEYEILLREDKKNLPYGTKTPSQLLELVAPILQSMVAEGCAVIVVACNTVTTTIISELRSEISVPLVGIEPMVKPAAGLTNSGTIAIFATPTTLASNRYKALKKEFAEKIKIIEPDCSNWSFMIENNRQDELDIKKSTELALNAGADIIVLGCTHYHWIEEEVRSIAGNRAKILQPEQAIIARLKEVISVL